MVAIQGEDRRLTNRLMAFWSEVKGEDPLPSDYDICSKILSDIWPSCVKVTRKEIEKGRDYSYEYIGDDIINAYKFAKLIEKEVPFLISDRADKLTGEYAKIFASKKPFINEGEFINSKGKTVKYRQCLLPFGDPDDNVGTIFGGMRYRIC